MPTLANLQGLKVQMFPADHNPPHFHLVRGDREAMVSISTLEVLAGTISARDLVLGRTWARQNRELLENEWSRLNRR